MSLRAHENTASTDAPPSTDIVTFKPTTNSSSLSLPDPSSSPHTADVSPRIRLFVGAFLSIFDMITDVNAIFNFLSRSQVKVARSLIIMLSINLFVQLAIDFVQKRKIGVRALLLEFFFTLTGLAPGVHAYRVARGYERQSKEPVDPRSMLILAKVVELVFEAVPGLLLQLYAYLTLEHSSYSALVSISTSAATTAFGVTAIFFDKDSDAETRSWDPTFWGVLPSDATSRTLSFISLFFFSGSHIFGKAFGVALFWATFGGRAVFLYYGCELAAFFLVKIVRRDFFFWVPVNGILTNVVLACVGRFGNKVMVDFTGNLVARHPCNAGELTWTLTLIWSQVSAVISVVLYQEYYDEEADGGNERRRSKISATAMYSIVGSLVVVWILSFTTFIKLINKEYLHTFFGTKTGSQHVIHVFRIGTNDQMKLLHIFRKNAYLWESIREEVITYTHANWDRWQTEKADWFTEEFIGTIPDEFIPHVNKDRRRSSALLGALGAHDLNSSDSPKKSASYKVAPA